MNIQVGEKYLITTDMWFFCPDGHTYKAVHGTVRAILNDEASLGIKTNRGSTNWYVSIGNTLIAGCQIHYAVRADNVNFKPVDRERIYEGKPVFYTNNISHIYNADVQENKDEI